ncbi:MAG: hypothetical protein ACK2T7_13235 [Anaerolineales bacterium]
MKNNLIDSCGNDASKGVERRSCRPFSHKVARVVLIILVLLLSACSLPRPSSPGASGGSDSSTPGTTITPTASSGDAGGAVLNLNRSVTYNYPTGQDEQKEVGAIPLVFTKSTEGPLIVEGSGKTEWIEVTNFTGCSYTSKTEGQITVTGLFSKDDCKFHLTIATKFSQPTTSYQSQDPETCSGSVVFSQTEFSSQIVLDPVSGRNKVDADEKAGWYSIAVVTISDLKSDEVEFCFTPEVIKRTP